VRARRANPTKVMRYAPPRAAPHGDSHRLTLAGRICTSRSNLSPPWPLLRGSCASTWDCITCSSADTGAQRHTWDCITCSSTDTGAAEAYLGLHHLLQRRHGGARRGVRGLDVNEHLHRIHGLQPRLACAASGRGSPPEGGAGAGARSHRGSHVGSQVQTSPSSCWPHCATQLVLTSSPPSGRPRLEGGCGGRRPRQCPVVPPHTSAQSLQCLHAGAPHTSRAVPAVPAVPARRDPPHLLGSAWTSRPPHLSGSACTL